MGEGTSDIGDSAADLAGPPASLAETAGAAGLITS